MSELMTIEEAIEYYQEVIRNAERQKCVDEHIQLIKWLKELSYYREKYRLEKED